ncbi:hypothetical protein Syun_030303 [Stephania yunnanensis]|uniref:NB-ARC domain-containing protein n=1 Tax=Stephania yunnanensis TaxID=152371 RepID=A0AAP0EFJ8_9MAGN
MLRCKKSRAKRFKIGWRSSKMLLMTLKTYWRTGPPTNLISFITVQIGLLKEIVEVVTKSRFDHDNLDVIQDGVLEKVRGKKFLLVLDDVWSDKQDEWNMLKSCLTSAAKGSSIVVTTRLETVASITGTISIPYRLGGLSKDDCWLLFRYYAFGMRNELEKPNLVSIGREIVKKCGGLPLAAKALGSLLRFKANERQWELIRDSEIWDVEEEANKENTHILPALRLSYNNLSPRARQCFAYCSLFPKDYNMSKEDLVYLWLSNGLLDVRKMEPEDVGEDVFSELLLHSFFQDIKENEEDDTMTFKIHDLMHDLASSVMKREHSHIVVDVDMRRNLINNNIQDDEIRPRHLSITLSSSNTLSSVVSEIHLLLFQRHHLRTLFLFSQSYGELKMSSHDISTISDLKFLRALRFDLWRCKMELLPVSFGNKLKHLRYLSLSRCNIESLQAELFCGMKSLRILDLSHNRNIKTLPHSMGMYLEHLRWLNLGWCDLSSLQVEAFRGMKNLQILDLSENENMQTLPDSIGRYWEHLRQLKLTKCGLSSLQVEAFRGMKNLQILDLSENVNMQTLPDSIGRYWEHLRQLKLTICGLSSLPAELFCSMKNLQFLDLSKNYRMRMLPDSIGNLEHLRHLNLSSNSRLELLPKSLGNLTELETLKLRECWELNMLPKTTSRLCNLRHLENEYCGNLRGMPSGIGQLTRLEKLSRWRAGRVGSDIQELRGLNLLSGSLQIFIESTRSEETKPCHRHEEELLINKKYLLELHITFCDGCDYDDENGAEHMLRVLKPPANIERLSIDNYGMTRLPDWMQMKDPQSSLSRLTSIKFADMNNIEEWSLNWKEKECLPALQSLSFIGCYQLKALPEELENLTTLKTLVLDGCGAFSVPQGFQKLTSLESLQITCCKRLMSLPQLQLLTNLKELEIRKCPELKFVFYGLHHLTSVEKLNIRLCPGVVIHKVELDSLIALRGAISNIRDVVYQ